MLKSDTLTRIQTIYGQIEELKLKIRPLYYVFLSEEASRIIGQPLTCKEISITVISYERRLKQLEFIDKYENTFAKCVQLCYDDNTTEMQECTVIGMDEYDASDFMIDMLYSVDWDFFQ